MQKTIIVVSCAIIMLNTRYCPFCYARVKAPASGELPSRRSRSPSDRQSSHHPQQHRHSRSPIDFSGYAGESIDEWLHSKGFKFEEDAKHRDRLALSIKDGALILEAKEQLRGYIIKDGLHLADALKVRIDWGVIKYPEGASYEKKVRNEPIMIYFFFGEEKISSGHLLSPDLPYFIALYLCENDKIGTPYKGRAYHDGGRFVCVGNPPPQETIVTEFDLDHAFRTYFEKTEVPPISGLAIEMDTSSSGGGGKAAGYVRRIAFLE